MLCRLKLFHPTLNFRNPCSINLWEHGTDVVCCTKTNFSKECIVYLFPIHLPFMSSYSMKTIHQVITDLSIFYIPVHCDTIRQFYCYKSCRAIKGSCLSFCMKTYVCVYICLFQVLSEIRVYWIAWATCKPVDMKKESYFYGGDPANNHPQTLCSSSLFILNIWKAQFYLTVGTVNRTI